MPQRIQRRRTKGWVMPAHSIYVGRPTIWGNPFTCNGDRALAVSRFRERVRDSRRIEVCGPTGYYYVQPSMSQIRQLTGLDLACWCPLDSPCHADVLLDIANSEGR